MIRVQMHNGVDTAAESASSQDLVFSYLSKNNETMLMLRDSVTGEHFPIPASVKIARNHRNYSEHYDCVLRNYNDGLVHAYAGAGLPVGLLGVHEYTYNLDTGEFVSLGDAGITYKGLEVTRIDAGVGLPNGDILFGTIYHKTPEGGVAVVTNKIFKLNPNNKLKEVADVSHLLVRVSDLNLFSDGTIALVGNTYPTEKIYRVSDDLSVFELVFENTKWANSGILFADDKIIVYANEDEIVEYDENGVILSITPNPDFGAAYDGMASLQSEVAIQKVTVRSSAGEVLQKTVFSNDAVYEPNNPIYYSPHAFVQLRN